MTKKKLSGQTITIIVLAILLLLTCVFGGVYAYYSTNSAKISGIVKMANLKIEMRGGTGTSGSSEILNTNSYYIPGQVLPNTALTVTNSSNTQTYIAVVYTVKAVKIDTNQEIDNYDLSNPLIDIENDSTWHDSRFTDSETGVDFRYLMIPTPLAAVTDPSNPTTITVIPEGKLMLHKRMGNAYQSTVITLTFRAYIIGSQEGQLNTDLNNLGANATVDQKCNVIMNAMYNAFDKQMV